MMQVAWLRSRVSDKAKESRWQKINAKDPDDFRLQIPECRAQYLLDIALKLGPAKSSGFGLQPISPIDIKAYCDIFKADLSIWEAEQLMQLAKLFVGSHGEYDGNDCAAPITQIPEEYKADVSKRLLEMLVKRSQANKRSAPIGGRT
jgi:hypothetical protein